MLSLNLYDRMLNNEITEQEALSMGSLTITSPMLNFDLSSFDAMVWEYVWMCICCGYSIIFWDVNFDK